MLGSHLSRQEILNEIYSYLYDYHKDYIIEKSCAEGDAGVEQPKQPPPPSRSTLTLVLEISLVHLSKRNGLLASLLVKNPILYLDLFAKQALQIYSKDKQNRHLLPTVPADADSSLPRKSLPIFKIAITSPLSAGSNMLRDKIPRCDDNGRLIFFKGTCVKAELVKLLETTKIYRCRKCNAPVAQSYDIYNHNSIPKPTKCPGDSNEPCSGTKFILQQDVEQQQVCIDYQEIKVQEQVSSLSLGTMPQNITVILTHEHLVDVVKPGQDVLISATVIQRWKKVNEGERCEVEVCLLANQVTLLQNQMASLSKQHKNDHADVINLSEYWKDIPAAIRCHTRDRIVSSFSPEIFGMHLVKLALLLVLIGGIPSSSLQQPQQEQAQTDAVDDPFSSPNESKSTRPESHLLLIGDPGTAKSQLLKAASYLSPRSVFTTSTNSSTAGLTVSLSRDSSFNGEWTMEPGALVLADGGVCCIDEFGRCRGQDLSVLHEAMELGTVSVAKAGICCKLSSRCTILAATNPKLAPKSSLALSAASGGGGGGVGWSSIDGSRVSESGLASITHGIASPLLSRFDLILAVLDSKDTDRDIMVSTFILEHEIYGSNTSTTLTQTKSQLTEARPVLDFDNLKEYIALCKTYSPQMLPASSLILKTYYQIQRQTDASIHSSTISTQPRTTIRLLESLVRLAQAHARLRCSVVLEVFDAVTACLMMEASVLGCLGITIGACDVCPDDSDAFYQSQEYSLLSRLDLLYLIPNRDDGCDLNLVAACDDFIERINKTQLPKPVPVVFDEDNFDLNLEEEDEEKEKEEGRVADRNTKKQRIQDEVVADELCLTALESEYSWDDSQPLLHQNQQNQHVFNIPKEGEEQEAEPDDPFQDMVKEVGMDDDFEEDGLEIYDSSDPHRHATTPAPFCLSLMPLGVGYLGFSGRELNAATELPPAIAPLIHRNPNMTDEELMDLFTPEN